MRKNTMHLFAGGGGGILGDLILGHTPIVAVEWDKYACKVLRERVQDGWFEGMHVYEGDVRLFNSSEYEGRVDCIHAGFPCQDISVAGKQAGVGEDTRSGLYREVLRIADVVRPGELFMENVSAILSNGLGVVLADLSARGYSARWVCLRASDVGANHHRDRWWLLARKAMANTTGERVRGRKRDIHQTDGRQNGKLCEQFIRAGSESENVANSNSEDWRASCMEQDGRTDGRNEFSGCGSVFPYPDTERLQRGGIKPSARTPAPCSQPGLRNGNGNGEESRYAESSVGCMDDGVAAESHINWWKSEPYVGRVTLDNKDRVAQLKALGNGQVPLQMAVAYSILEELFNA